MHDFAGTAPFSVAFWARPSATYATIYQRRMVAKESGGGWLLMLWPDDGSADANKVFFQRRDGGAGVDQVKATAPLVAGSWSFVAGTYDGSTMRLYIDGTEVASVASSVAVLNHTASLTFARTGSNRFGGNLDEAAIYNKAITAQQVQGLYSAGRG